MEAERVVEKILSEAKAEAEKIKQKAQGKQADEQAKFDQQLAEYGRQTDALAQKAAEDEKLHLMASARMRISKEHLAEKRKMLDEVFKQAYESACSTSDEQYRNMITDLMAGAAETGDEEVIIGKDEKRIDQGLIDQVNSRLADDKKRELKLAEQRQQISGGFILKRGKIRSNVSFEVLLAQARDSLEIELAKELFG